MAKVVDHSRFLNPCMLHLQKLGLELMCPLCLELPSRPLFLPCNHLICSSCLPKSVEYVACLVCKLPFPSQDLRPAPMIENMVSIYKSLDATLGSFHLHLKASAAGVNGANNESERAGVFSTSSSQVDMSAYNGIGVTKYDVPALNGLSSNHFEKDRESPKLHANNGDQQSPETPPPFGDAKDSDDDNNDQESGGAMGSKDQGGEALSQDEFISLPPPVDGTKNSSIVNFDKRPTDPIENDLSQGLKRQKIDEHQNLFCKVCPPNRCFACALCQSTQPCKESGPMLHYINGTAIESDHLNFSNALHVHKSCIEWAPQVYFVSETAMNLESEIARGAKLKCSCCGKKGAALGCYCKSCRRSYHFPCAAKIEGCRWDYDNFLMLCPAHVALKFPNEKSKSGKKLKTNQSTQIACSHLSQNLSPSTQRANELWLVPADSTSKWVLCGSSLSTSDKDLVTKLSLLSGASLTKAWDSSVTHIIASTDENGACGRTLKVLMGILNGRWILNMEWIRACLRAKHPVAEEPYEVSCDIYGCQDGPKNGRKRILEKAPKLFGGMNFYFSGEFESFYRGYLEDLIAAAGGIVLSSKEEIRPSDAVFTITIIIYSLEPPEAFDKEKFSSTIEKRLEEADSLASGTGARVAGHTWLLDSIAACKLLPVVS